MFSTCTYAGPLVACVFAWTSKQKQTNHQNSQKNFYRKTRNVFFLKKNWIPTLPAKVSGFIKNRVFEVFLETFGVFLGGIVYFLNKIKYCWLHNFQFPDFFWSTWLLIRVYFVLLVFSPKVTHRLSHSSFCLLNFIKTTIFSKNVFLTQNSVSIGNKSHRLLRHNAWSRPFLN